MRILFTALAATLFAGAALAETDVDLTVLRPVVETAIVDGVEVETIDYEPVTSAVPGETLTYRISLSNDSTASADDIRMVLPVDDSLTFVPGSLRTDTGALLSVSVDSGATFGDLEALEESEAETVWRLTLKSGADAQAVLRALVEAGVKLTRFEPRPPSARRLRGPGGR